MSEEWRSASGQVNKDVYWFAFDSVVVLDEREREREGWIVIAMGQKLKGPIMERGGNVRC